MTITTKINLVPAFHKKIESMIKRNVYVGIPGDHKQRQDGQRITNTALGYIHEKGSPARNIPARPFLVPGVQQSADKISKILGDEFVDVKSADIDVALNDAGLAAVQTVKRRITQSTDIQPLSPATIHEKRTRKERPRKGKITPLIDTGQMINSITYVVRDK